MLAVTTSLVAAAALPASGFGGFIFFLSTTAVVSSFCDLGVSARAVTSYRGGEGWDEGKLASYWSAQLWSYSGGALLALLCAATLARDQFNVAPTFVALGAVNGAAIGLSSFVAATLQAREAWATRFRTTLGHALWRTGLTVASVFTWRDASLAAAAATLASLTATSFLLLLPTTRGDVRIRMGSFSSAREIWARSGWFAVANAAGALSTYFPFVAVSRYGGAPELAVFGLATQLAAGPNLLLASVMTLLLPPGADPRVALRSYLRHALLMLLPVLGVLAVGALMVPILLPMIFGSRFAGAIYPFELLVVGVGILAIANPLQFLHYRYDDERFIAVMDGVMLLATIGAFLGAARILSPAVAGAAAIVTGYAASRTVGTLRLLQRYIATRKAPGVVP